MSKFENLQMSSLTKNNMSKEEYLYLKYKTKYLNLKKEIEGGAPTKSDAQIEIILEEDATKEYKKLVAAAKPYESKKESFKKEWRKIYIDKYNTSTVPLNYNIAKIDKVLKPTIEKFKDRTLISANIEETIKMSEDIFEKLKPLRTDIETHNLKKKICDKVKQDNDFVSELPDCNP